MPSAVTELSEGARIALRALRASKMRALLTTLGIIIGIVSVTATLTVINGIENEFDRSMAMLGDDALFVQQMPWFFSFDDWWKYRQRPEIEEDLGPYIRERSQYASAVAPVTGITSTLRRGRDEIGGVGVEASTTAYVDTGGADVEEGRFFTEVEDRAGRQVVVIGADVREALFPSEDPIGKHLRISGKRFEVVGTLVARGNFLGLASGDERVIIPLQTYKRLFDPTPGVAIKVAVADVTQLDEAQEELGGLVRIYRGLDPLEDDNFSINRQEQFRQLFQTLRVTTYGVGIFLTALSLLVGGIGVMNIMFVSVKERTREIGVRKALGATRRAVLVQFLIEAVVICLVGGAIGVGLAGLIAIGINQVFTAQLTLGTVLVAFTICAATGLLFGLAPAWQAAKARPVEALRYE
ncbi:MAG: ABC transporter permease [Bacteroidota bacterium]